MKENILIIEDEENIRFSIEKTLLKEGYTVSTASSYSEGIKEIFTKKFHLIFLDIILGGGKTGIDILRELKEKNINCPVIIFTGYPTVDTASEAVRLGAFDYMFKPVRKNALLHITDRALKHKRISDELEKTRLNLEAIFRSVTDGIISIDKNLNIVELNEAACNICGFSRKIATGKSLVSLQTGCSGKCVNALKETLKTEKEFKIPSLECRAKIVSVVTSPLFDPQGLLAGAVMVIRDETRLTYLEKMLNERIGFYKMVGKSSAMKKIYNLLEVLAQVESTVLITGESGTGKELVAEALHYKGLRREKPMVKVNCGALSENLLESELFGHVKGAFTGAVKDKTGRFQKADGGTIFLDEIGNISGGMQLSLLRVLQEKEFERVGDSTPIKVDIRILAATNQELAKKVKTGEFRQDLYYRLKVVEIKLPPLREKKEDIPLLTEHFIKKFNKKFNKNIMGISHNVSKIFMSYNWPGNLRELEHTLEYASIVCNKTIIEQEDLPEEFQIKEKREPFKKSDTNEEEMIRNILEETEWNKAKAARTLNMSRLTLYKKIKKYGITKS